MYPASGLRSTRVYDSRLPDRLVLLGKSPFLIMAGVSDRVIGCRATRP